VEAVPGGQRCRSRRRFIDTGAERRDPHVSQGGETVAQPFRTGIARMVVGERHEVEARPGEQLRRRWIGLEHVRVGDDVRPLRER
jgi:hypothetical protein